MQQAFFLSPQHLPHPQGDEEQAGQGEGEPAQQPPGHLVGQHPAQGQGGQGKYKIGQLGQGGAHA